RAVQVPAIRCSARAAAWLVVRHTGPRARIIGLLCFPGDDAAFDIDLPAASSRAVHTVRRAHDLVVLPSQPIAVLPFAVFLTRLAVAVGEGFAMLGEEHQAVEKVAHDNTVLANDPAQLTCSTSGTRRTSVMYIRVSETQTMPYSSMKQLERIRVTSS